MNKFKDSVFVNDEGRYEISLPWIEVKSITNKRQIVIQQRSYWHLTDLRNIMQYSMNG